MNLEFMKKWIADSDKKSDEFFQIYQAISEKYYDFDEPNDFQKASKMLKMILDRGEADEIIILNQIFSQICMMNHKGEKACSLTVGFKDKEYNIEIYTDKQAFHSMKKMLENVVIQKARS